MKNYLKKNSNKVKISSNFFQFLSQFKIFFIQSQYLNNLYKHKMISIFLKIAYNFNINNSYI